MKVSPKSITTPENPTIPNFISFRNNSILFIKEVNIAKVSLKQYNYRILNKFTSVPPRNNNIVMKQLIIVIVILLSYLTNQAKEGMWVPIFLEGVIMEEMKLNGLKLSAQDIYDVNNSSLKDAVLRFGGGCTAEIISSNGLLLTNHHCGYGRIQSHSSLENDYLQDGFWAKSKSEELSNPGLTATRIVRIKDVTKEILLGTDMKSLNRDSIIKVNSETVIKDETKDSHYSAFVRAFYYGNQYLIFITETFEDIRLVGAPPSSIGKYGFDTDNWVWPRHTGDFSLFRIYADADNNPAAYNEDNVPYIPKHHLPISMNGYKEGDFTMVYGFPYRTNEYLTSDAVDFIMNVSNPVKINIRTKKLGVLDRKMSEDQLIRIKYAAKQSSTSNAWKKWKGQNKGLSRNKTLEKKRQFEQEMKFKLELYADSFAEYQGLQDALKIANKEINEVSLARDYYIETAYYGTDVLKLSYQLLNYQTSAVEEKEIDEEKVKNLVRAHFKNYDYQTDFEVFKAILPLYIDSDNNFYKPKVLLKVQEKYSKDLNKWMDKTYSSSNLTNEKDFMESLEKDVVKTLKSLEKDPIFSLARDLNEFYKKEISPAHRTLSKELEILNRNYYRAIVAVFPEGVYYPDANGTLRLTFGKIQGMKPNDAVEYNYYTTLEGAIAKFDPNTKEYDLPNRLIELYKEKDYGVYGVNGQMNVCFIASNHTSGGNSGSPVLNGKGELIGLNFDRNWEGTMSDIMYDVNQCRNISVDIRYVLFIIDKFAEAKYLVDEMTLISSESLPELNKD